MTLMPDSDPSVGLVLERRSQRALDSLRALNALTAQVRRGGPIKVIAALEIIPGDVNRCQVGEAVLAAPGWPRVQT